MFQRRREVRAAARGGRAGCPRQLFAAAAAAALPAEVAESGWTVLVSPAAWRPETPKVGAGVDTAALPHSPQAQIK